MRNVKLRILSTVHVGKEVRVYNKELDAVSSNVYNNLKKLQEIGLLKTEYSKKNKRKKVVTEVHPYITCEFSDTLKYVLDLISETEK